jgi:hypothetical protein
MTLSENKIRTTVKSRHANERVFIKFEQQNLNGTISALPLA